MKDYTGQRNWLKVKQTIFTKIGIGRISIFKFSDRDRGAEWQIAKDNRDHILEPRILNFLYELIRELREKNINVKSCEDAYTSILVFFIIDSSAGNCILILLF